MDTFQHQNSPFSAGEKQFVCCERKSVNSNFQATVDEDTIEITVPGDAEGRTCKRRRRI